MNDKAVIRAIDSLRGVGVAVGLGVGDGVDGGAGVGSGIDVELGVGVGVVSEVGVGVGDGSGVGVGSADTCRFPAAIEVEFLEKRIPVPRSCWVATRSPREPRL